MAGAVVAGLARFVLGTVQFGVPYGRLRLQELMSEASAFALLDAAWDLGIRAFDTSEAYGLAAARLSDWLRARRRMRDANVVTKVKPVPEDSASKRALAALDRFNGANVTILAHDFSDGRAWGDIAAAAARRRADAGQSVYTPDEVRRACTLAGVSRVQAPGNVFDLRASDARGDSPASLDLRSVFLQGLLLDAPEEAERRVAGGGALSAAVARAAAEIGADAACLLVRAALDGLRLVDRMVLGADTPEQLRVIPSSLALAPELARSFAKRARELGPVVDTRVLTPRTWN